MRGRRIVGVIAVVVAAAVACSGAGEPGRQSVGQVTRAQLSEIAAIKMEDLNARDPEAAAKVIAGTARSMGIEVVDE